MTGRLTSFLAVTVTALTLAACAPSTQDQIARGAAKSVVARAATERLPGVPVTPFIDCVIDNASFQQILVLAADSVTGPTASTWEIITGIARKPETLRCLTAKGLSALPA